MSKMCPRCDTLSQGQAWKDCDRHTPGTVCPACGECLFSALWPRRARCPVPA